MLWLEKYRPKTFAEMRGHLDNIQILNKYTLNTIPHIIIHGKSGFGKKTLIKCLVHHLFGRISSTKIRKSEIKTNSKSLEVSFLESDEYIEICPSEYNYQDRLVIQNIIKELAQSKPILSLFHQSRTPSIKIIVITSAEDISPEAQAALRRTIEMYSQCFRIFLICTQLSKIIEPIRSRCICFRVSGYKDNEVEDVLNEISKKEDFILDSSDLKDIINISKGSLRRAICMLELLWFKKNEDMTKRQKFDIGSLKLDWEIALDDIVSNIRRNQKTETIVEIRKKLYALINSCISPRTILLELFKKFSYKEKLEIAEKIVNLALTYEERIRTGNKGIYHLEAFIVGCMCVYKGIM